MNRADNQFFRKPWGFIKRHPWWSGTAAALILLLFFIFVILPPIVGWGLEKWLESQGHLEARIESVDFNLFTGNLTVHSLVTESRQEGRLKWVRASLEIDWWPVLKKRIRLDDFELSSAVIGVVQETNGDIYIGGIQVFSATDEQDEDPSADSWEIGFGNIDLREVVIWLQTPETEQRLTIHRAHVDPMQTWNPSSSGVFSLQASLADSRIDIQGNAQPYSPTAKISAAIDAEKIPLGWIGPLLNIRELDGSFSAETDVRLTWGSSSIFFLSEGSLAVSELTGEAENIRFGPSSIAWQGSLQMQVPRGRNAPARVTADGTLISEHLQLSRPQSHQAVAVEILRLELNAKRSAEAPNGKADFQIKAEGQIAGGQLTGGSEQPLIVLSEATVAEFQIGGNYTPDGELAYQGRLAVSRLVGQYDQLRLRQAALQIEGSGTMTLGPVADDAAALQFNGAAAIESLDLLDTQAQLALAGDKIRLEGEWLMPSGQTAGPDDQGLSINAPIVTADQLRLTDARAGITLAVVPQLEAQDIRLDPAQLKLQRIRISQAALLQRSQADPEQSGPEQGYVAIIDTATMQQVDINLKENIIGLSLISIQGLDGFVRRDAEGKFEIAQLWPARVGDEQPEEPRPASTNWDFRIAQVSVGGGSSLRYRDVSVRPAVDLRLSKIDGEVRQLDSRHPAQPSKLALQTTVNQNAQLKADGTIQPFGPKISMDIAGVLKQFALPEIRGYPSKFWGYTVRSGQLDADFNVNVDQDKLDASIPVVITDLKLERQVPDESDEFTQELGMPLNAALDLLRDRDKGIRLTLALTGSLADPEIDASEIIGKALRSATFKAVKTAALTYFAPLGAAYVATKLFGRAVALKLDPVIFQPGNSELTDGMRDHLNEVAQKLAERPGVRLLLCGMAVPADRDPLRRSALLAGRTGSPDRRDPVDNAMLLELAENRSESVRRYLVSQGIAQERLVICAPEFDNREDANPKVELAI